MFKKATIFLTAVLVVLVYSTSTISQDLNHLNDDSHLVTGEINLNTGINFMESIDASGEWCPTGTFPDLPAATFYQAAAWLGDTLYVQAPTTTGTPASTIFKYTVGGSWTAGTSIPVALTGGAMVAANNKLYFLGGAITTITTGPVNTVYEYNPSTGNWITLAPMPASLNAHGAVAWGDSVIFVVGGPYTGSATNLDVHYYRITTNTWNTIAGSLPAGQGRRSFGLGIAGNKIVMSAGFNTAFLKNTYIGTIVSDASQIVWTAAPDVPTVWTGLSRPGGAGIDKYFFLVCGEAGGSPITNRYYDTTHVMDVELGQWVDIIDSKPFKMSNIWNAVAPRFHGDTIKVYVPGGYGSVSGATPGAGTAVFDAVGCGDLIVIPVELSAFTASVNYGNVTLNWQTASESNNQGFEVHKRSGAGYTSVGYIQGYGTTSETQNYSFVDRNVNPGTYYYRLKQIDFDGTFAYSDEINVEVNTPVAFGLNQNYPNPFNPATVISFNLPIDARVTLKLFDVLGQELITLIDRHLGAGIHDHNFDASGLNSGVYFYRIEAAGIDGQNFTSVKKMMLTK